MADELLMLYERGLPHREIAAALGISRQAVGYRLNVLGLTRRSPRRGDDNARFDRFVERAGAEECWLWMGPLFKDGYGMFSRWPRVVRAHRFAFERSFGPPSGEVMHECDEPRCVNPRHLRDGTRAENEADKLAKGRQARGERHGCARYSADQVERVKALLSERIPRQQIAEATGVRLATVHTIASGRQWREVVRR